MRTLRIENGGKIVLDGEYVDISKTENKSEFLSSILTLDVELDDDINVSDIIHFFYDARELIQSILSEEYEVVRALVLGSSLPRDYKELRVYKSFTIEKEGVENQEFIYMTPEVEAIVAAPSEDGVRAISGLPIKIDENITLVHNDVVIESKTKINLLDLLTCLFDELPALIKDGVLLSQ